MVRRDRSHLDYNGVNVKKQNKHVIAIVQDGSIALELELGRRYTAYCKRSACGGYI